MEAGEVLQAVAGAALPPPRGGAQEREIQGAEHAFEGGLDVRLDGCVHGKARYQCIIKLGILL